MKDKTEEKEEYCHMILDKILREENVRALSLTQIFILFKKEDKIPIFWTKTRYENFHKYYIPTSVLLCFCR